jgi:hypothetical protein
LKTDGSLRVLKILKTNGSLLLLFLKYGELTGSLRVLKILKTNGSLIPFFELTGTGGSLKKQRTTTQPWFQLLDLCLFKKIKFAMVTTENHLESQNFIW